MENEKGFTIVEVVVVIAILVTSMITVIGMFFYNSQTNQESEAIAQGLSFSERVIEDVRAVASDMVEDQGLDEVYGNDAEFTVQNIKNQMNHYYATVIDGIDSTVEPNSDNKFSSTVLNSLNIPSNIDAVLLKKSDVDDMIAVVKISDYLQRDNNGNVVQGSGGNDIVIKEIKQIDIEVKWLDRNDNIKSRTMSSLITRR